jgi:hypothetical protein
MKRTCNGCKALKLGNGAFYCGLGYNVEQIGDNKGYDIPVGSKPVEDCPKPMTDKEYEKIR